MVNLHPVSVQSIPDRRDHRTLSTCRTTLLHGLLQILISDVIGQMNFGKTFENSKHHLGHAPLRANIRDHLGQ